MLRDFEVNALGPVRVFRAVWEGGLFPGEGEKKFVLMTSSIGSIGTLETESLPGIVSIFCFFAFFFLVGVGVDCGMWYGKGLECGGRIQGAWLPDAREMHLGCLRRREGC